MALASAFPAPAPEPLYQNIDADYPTIYYDPNPSKKSKRDLSNIRPLLTRGAMVEKRTSTPDGTCGPAHGYTCTTWGYGMCCGMNNLCDQSYTSCGGGCQSAYGYCTEPTLQLAYDADFGDIIWDPVTDNVFDADLGDGMIFYGIPPEDDWEYT
ncbi:hypothetical protein BDZ91DRAFT_698612 [Kalaharituber pfeilii]|nr:hypothetical protein BDZ91DRAFT_698612 [Kalaharituber pfeilii]